MSTFHQILSSNPVALDFIQNSALDGISYLDFENPEKDWVSDGFWANLGYREEILPPELWAWKTFVFPKDLIVLEENFKKMGENAAHKLALDLRYITKTGSMVWMRCKGIAVTEAKAKVKGVLLTHINITRDKEKEEKNELLFDSIDEGFCIIEMIFDENKKPIDYRFLVVNASFERQTGMKDAEGKRMREFAPDHEEHWFEIYGKIAITGEPLRFENRAEQLQRWYDVYAFRFGDPKNMQVAILFNDITERKKAERTILSLNQELAKNLGQLESTNRELESFTYSVSHDLRAPLRAINGYATILAEDFTKDLSEEARAHMESIQRNSQKMGNLIDDLLNLARLGRKELVKGQLDMETMVKGCVEDTCQQDSINESIFSIGALPSSSGDHILFKQVWSNLISNACKYSKGHASPLVEIGSRKTEEEIQYYVKDNGVGFDMKYADKLFGVFQRLHDETEFEGTGVGLAIVHRIVTRHGGKVWAEAKVGEGACFYFSLPMNGLQNT